MTSLLTQPSLWNWSSPVWFAVAAIGAVAIWSRRGRLGLRDGLWAAAALVLAAAFVSPIGTLANGYLFSVHIVQHSLLLLVVPLLAILGIAREAFAKTFDRPWLVLVARPLRYPQLGWICGMGMMWFWHMPSMCSVATQSDAVGLIRSVSFLAAGLAFWWPIFAPIERHRLEPLTAIVYLFSACLGCTLLGIYIAFTPASVCPAFASSEGSIAALAALYRAGWTPALDQQLGGLLMWVPPCSLYVGTILAVLCRWYSEGEFAKDSRVPEAPRLPEVSA
jgi:cytochrome c oxidase assembly factor CtaG